MRTTSVVAMHKASKWQGAVVLAEHQVVSNAPRGDTSYIGRGDFIMKLIELPFQGLSLVQAPGIVDELFRV